MSHECKEISLKCIVWSVKNCDHTLSTDIFTIQDCECKLQFHVESFLGIKTAHLYFKSNTKLRSSVTISLRVLSNSEAIFFETRDLTGAYEEIWKHTGISFLDSLLTFEFIINAIPSTEKQPESLTHKRAFKEVNAELLNSESNIHLQALSRDFSRLLNESGSCDIEINCDGKSFKAHGIVLAARSSVFSAMLRSNMLESKTGQIKVEDFKAPVFLKFLRYLYCGTLPEFNLDSAKQFYEISDKYGVKELKRACSEYLTKNLTESSACEVLVLADQHSDKDFRKNVISFIVDNSIPQSDKSWPNFCKNYCNLANEVMLLYIQKCSTK